MANNLVTIPRDKLQEIGEKMTENKILKGTVETQNTTIKNLTKENKELKKEIKKIQEDNKAKEQDMKKKFMEFHSEQKKMQSELEKYQAVPEFKGILDRSFMFISDNLISSSKRSIMLLIIDKFLRPKISILYKPISSI